MLNFQQVNRTLGTLLVLALLVDYSTGLPKGIYVILLGVWAVLTVIGAFHIRWNYHVQALHARPDTPNNWVAITFDDGPHPDFTPKILQLLRAHQAQATFFCIGQQVAAHPDIVKTILADGHTVGNHTYTHSKGFGFFGTQKVTEELQKTTEAIAHATQLQPHLYRPAFGVTNPHIKKAVAQLSLQAIGWSIRSLDTTPRSQQRILDRITRRLKRGDIILLHDTSAKTVAVLEQLLLFLQQNKLQSVTVDRLLDLDAYA